MTPDETVNARRLAASLLYCIESRGYDATGAAWRKVDGTVELQKRDVPARRFNKDVLSVPRSASNVILHTRFSTQGSELNNDNNHPVKVGPIVGVHNGMISNDDTLFARMGVADKRVGEVDTEAIFAAIFYGPQLRGGEGDDQNWRRLPGCKTPWDALSDVRGSAAVAWLDERDDTGVMHLGKTRFSPLVWAQTPKGSLIFASTYDALAESCDVMRLTIDKSGELNDGTYLRLNNGEVEEVQHFKTLSDYSYYGSGNVITIGERGAVTRQRGTYENAWEGDWDPTQRGDWHPSTYKAIDEELPFTVVPVPDSPLAESLDLAVEIKKDHVHFENNKKREQNIDTWLAGMNGSDQAVVSLGMSTKAFSRVGEWVSTTLSGEDVYAQLAELPESFPDGWYILRAMVPSPDCSDYEGVLIRRQHYEFEYTTVLGNTPALEAGEGTKVAREDEDAAAIAQRHIDQASGNEYVGLGVREFEMVNAAVLNDSEGGGV